MHHRSTTSIVCALALAGCGDYSAPSEVVNGTVTATLVAPNTDFAQYLTFTVTDRIQVVNNTGGTSEEYTQDAPQVVARVRDNMAARGYTFVPFTPGVTADLVIGLYAFLGDQAYGGYYSDWWYWGYYPYDCGYYYAGSYNFGTLVLRMGDFKNAPPASTGATVSIVWEAGIYGVLGTQSYNLQRVLASIDKAFAQSPYLQR
jgi:hypothetical protein